MASSDRDRWLSRSNEPRYNEGITARASLDASALSCFIAVARRCQPLIPAVFAGPAEHLESRVVAYWDDHTHRDAFLYEEKREMAMAVADHISHLLIANHVSLEDYMRWVAGHQFYERPSQPHPFETPLPNARPTLRPELNEALWILTCLFHAVGIYVPPPPAPEGNVPYIPYYPTSVDITSVPKHARAASLARSAMFFRQHASLLPHKQPFSLFGLTHASITPPKQEKAMPLSKKYYSQGTGIGIGTAAAKERTPLKSGISFFVAKLMEIRDVKQEVWGFLTQECGTPPNQVLKRQRNPGYAFDPELIAQPGTRTTAASNISLLLLFLKSRFHYNERPGIGTLINVSHSAFKQTRASVLIAPLMKLWTYSCTPIYVNGILDEGVHDFQVSFFDALMEMI